MTVDRDIFKKDFLLADSAIDDAACEAGVSYGGRDCDFRFVVRSVLSRLQEKNPPVAWLTRNQDGDPAMLFFDKTEAATYCDIGVDPEPLGLLPAPPGAAHPVAAPTDMQGAGVGVEPVKVYLVCTGELYEDQETYTRHEGAPPPLCDFERLYTSPQAVADAPEVRHLHEALHRTPYSTQVMVYADALRCVLPPMPPNFQASLVERAPTESSLREALGGKYGLPSITKAEVWK
jgi:hypothetical protein